MSENTLQIAGGSTPQDFERKPKGLRSWPTPNSTAVLTDCQFIASFLNHITDDCDSSKDSRRRRLAMMSIVSRLEPDEEENQGTRSGRDMVHMLLAPHKSYNEAATDREIEESVARSGPMYCKDIASFCAACTKCHHFRNPKVRSPIKIRPADAIDSEEAGFWEVKTDKQGNIVPFRPNYNDLMKAFSREHEFVTMSDTGLVYIYKDNHWQLFERINIRSFIETRMNPQPSKSQCNEFVDKIQRNNVRDQDWFMKSTDGLINLQNGVFNIQKRELRAHDSGLGFRYILPYSYDPKAKAPVFEQFLDDITKSRKDMSDVILEYIGYSIAGGKCYAEKAMILYGYGSNGKSTFMDTLKEVAGERNYSSLSLTALNNDQKRHMIDGKLFNIGEETSVKALGQSEVFKTMVTGGEIDVKKVYAPPYTIKNKCKLILSCNELPKSVDRSDGLYRRMLIVPFDAKFEGSTKDPMMREKLLDELPGIFNLAVEGYARLQSQGFRFSESASLEKAVADYKLENDNIRQWLGESVDTGLDDEYSLSKDRMFEDYTVFCQETGNFPLNKMVFFRSIRYLLQGSYKEKHKKTPDGRKRYVLGVKFK